MESILDPSTPLALRVSGHLMLGVVRIYARKVKYLMSDVTEVMWKVKMAYKLQGSNAVDMVEPAGHAVIDDPRYFGSIQQDFDFPELAETAFSQNMLSQYNELKAARGRTLNPQYQQQQAMAIQDAESVESSGRKKSSSKGLNLGTIPEDEVMSEGETSCVSELELMRGERSRSTLQSRARSSISSAGLKFIEDEIPAYIDDQDMFMDNPGYEPSAYDHDMFAGGYAAAAAPPLLESPLLPTDLSAIRSPEQEQAIEEEEGRSAPSAGETKKKVGLKRRVVVRKRPVVVLDERVELSSKTMKENLSDRGPILRRQPGQPLPRKISPEETISGEQLLSQPSVRGLCPELLELFQMTMTMGELPFPSLDPSKRKNAGVEDVEQTRLEGRKGEGRPSVLDQPWQAQGEGEIDRGYEEYAYEGGYDGGVPVEEDAMAAPPQLDAQSPPPMSPAQSRRSNNTGSRQSTAEKDLSRRQRISSLAPDGPYLLEGLDDDKHGEGVEVGVATVESCSARTAKVIGVLKQKFQETDAPLSFDELSAGASRRHAAGCFFEILQLNTWGLIQAEQPEPFGEITLTPTSKLWVAAH